MTAVVGGDGHPAVPPHQPRPGTTVRWAPIALGVLMCLGWAAVIWAVPHLHADPVLHAVARFAHLAALLVGFGAVLTVDWLGLSWLLGRHPLTDMLRLAQNAAMPIWAGLAGLTLSGLLLHPNLASWPTRIKLGLVLVIGLNGLYAHHLAPRLQAVADAVPRALMLRAATCAAISQAGWWSATLIGFLNAHHP